MTRMSIGEFAKVSGLTPKALRLYDELGLLPPAHVDPRSGYRSYGRAQLDRAQLVGWLRGLGMPLARIRVVCDLPPLAAAAEVISYWRQVEADTAARKELVTFLVDQLSGKDTGPAGVPTGWELRAASRTDRGLVRESNEDVCFAGRRLFAVADGFGARGSGRTAGTVAIDALAPLDADVPAARLLATLGSATAAVRAAVRDLAAAHAGATLTAMLWSGACFALAHVGDTRAYLLRGGELTQVTHDHTFVQSLVDDGRLTPEEAAAHPKRAALLRAYHGGDPTEPDPTEPDLHLREAHPGDRYLLCSDGLHAVVAESRVRHVLETAATPRDAVDRLSELAHDAGAPDNVACVVVDPVDPARR